MSTAKSKTRYLGFIGALFASVALLAAFAAPAFAQQAWRLDSQSNSTVPPGGTLHYFVQLANVGDENMDGTPIILTAKLPPGLFASSAILTDNTSGNQYICKDGDGVSPIDKSTSIFCENEEPVPWLGAASTAIEKLALEVEVDAEASGTLTTEFELSGGGAAAVNTVDPVTVTTDQPTFGIDAFDGQVTADAAGAPLTQAGGHPYAETVSLDFNTMTNPLPLAGTLWPVEPVKDILVDLPPGLVGNPTAAGQCTLAQLANTEAGFAVQSLCSPISQIGTTLIRFRGIPTSVDVIGPLPVFNVVPPPGVPARFGFNLLGTVVILDAEVRSGSDYGLSINARSVPEGLAISGTSVTFWGVPASEIHKSERACPGVTVPSDGGPTCGSGAPQRAFLRNPTACTAPGVGLPTTARVDSWDNPGLFRQATWFSHLPPAYPATSASWGPQVGPTDCDKVPFAPTFKARPEQNTAAKPTGFGFDLTVPQNDEPDVIGTGDLKKAVVTLPAGVRVSPSSADGLGACAPSQIDIDGGSIPSCPDSSKIGSVTIDTPLLADPLRGSVYLATPNDNPFGSLLSIYLVAEDSGVVVKLPGKVEADPISGQLTTTFDNNPQLPFSNLHLEFKSGARAPLTLPNACGDYTTHYELTSWSGKTVARDSSFTIDQGCGPRGFAPRLQAGLANPIAASKSPFVLRLTREDTEQEIDSLNLTTPQGLAAVLKGVATCPQSAIDAANRMGDTGQGSLELTSPSCPAASQIGTVQAGAGAGPSPFYVNTGKVYLAGPYRGAPLSLVILAPALAGPFDLGTVVVRSAIHLDPVTARITVKSDPIPSILHGIPLDIRDIRVSIDRPDFMVAPTSCEPMNIDASLLSTLGQSASANQRFQVSDCARLGFKPKLSLRLKGATHRRAHPKLIANLKARPGDANILRAQVNLPHSAFLDQSHIRTICTRVQFAQGNGHGSACPQGSIYGHVRAWSPLLGYMLQGNVYLRSSDHPLPDLVPVLEGPAWQPIAIFLVGRIDSKHGGIRTTFEGAPDAPVSRFTLDMQGGKKGLIENSRDLCRSTVRATAVFDGQNGKQARTRPVVKPECPKRHKNKKGREHHAKQGSNKGSQRS